MNILYLYNATQTYTNAVFDHLTALGRFSRHRAYFMHAPQNCKFGVDLSRFDAVCVHFSIRLPFDQFSESTIDELKEFKGLKFLFIQDEYDNTHRAIHWMKTLGFQLVFTVVPEHNIQKVYPHELLPDVSFRSNLTGYAPSSFANDDLVLPPSRRSIVVGYRARELPVRYGSLGFEKVSVGKLVREYCQQNDISCDINWTEDSRIYGKDWNAFMVSCRAMLGSESGSNVFDWDGLLALRVQEFRIRNPLATDQELYEEIIRPIEIEGLMNQISPRIFEAISARTVLVLFEGEYSGVIKPNVHFVPLKKDGSNLADVFEKLNDASFVDEMADRAYLDIIASGAYNYRAFVEMLDMEIELAASRLHQLSVKDICCSALPAIDSYEPSALTTNPIRHVLVVSPSIKPVISTEENGSRNLIIPLSLIWSKTPKLMKKILRPIARPILRAARSVGGE